MQDKIQEIMGLVDEYATKVERSVSSGDASVKFLTEEGEARKSIESKLRDLVREPLEVKYPKGYENPLARIAYDAGWHAAERAHGITNTSGV